jgi:hypothetical protein
VARDAYTIEEAETEIAQIRGDLDVLEEFHAYSDSTDVPVPSTAGGGIYSLGGTLSAIRVSGLTGGLPLTWADTGSQTVTAASASDLSALYTIPGGDCNVGTKFEMEAWGNGTWGATAQTLNLLPQVGGSAFGAQPSIGSSQFSTSAAFRWNVRLVIVCLQTGAGGSFHGYFTGTASQTANNVLSQTGNNGSIGFAGGPSANFAQDTTAAISLKIQASWSSTTGSPSISCHGTTVTRSGF